MQEQRHKLIISNRTMYREVELSSEIQSLKIGTGIECDVRLPKENFFEAFELHFVYHDGWRVTCSDNLYISFGKSKKLFASNLMHGYIFYVKYQESAVDLFEVEFEIDFDYEKKKYDIAIELCDSSELKIGGTPDCNIFIENVFIGNDWIRIGRRQDTIWIEDNSTKYGISVNGIKVENKKDINDNDFILFASFGICVKNNELYCDSAKIKRLNGLNSRVVDSCKNRFEYPKFNRNTRVKAVIPVDKIEILDPPAAPQRPSGNIVLQLTPAIVMLAVTIVLRGVMGSGSGAYIWLSVISMGIGILTSVAGIVTERRKYKKDCAERVKKYTAYITSKETYIEQCRITEEALLNETYYSLKTEEQLVNDFSENLFDRDVCDADYLIVRLGNGVKKAAKEINFKPKEQLECSDELARKPEELAIRYKEVYNVPITLNLRESSTVGIVGNRTDLFEFLKTITVDLAVRQYYTDTRLFFVIVEEDQADFQWIRLLPHLRNEQLNMRNIVYNTDSRNILFEYLYKELSSREAEKRSYPNLVLFIYRDNGIKSHPISRYINKAASIGVSFLFFEEYTELLPKDCDSIVRLNQMKGMVVRADDKNQTADFEYERIDTQKAEHLVSKLAPVYCEEVSLEGTLTKNITLFELLNILSVDDINLTENWKNAQVYKTMAAPLGVKSKKEIVYLDLNEKKHGPHGLVAGTTGSGKSEILQTYILSMATLFHPYDVSFVIIDFKGGGMVNQFKNLPHLIGAITNIDGREINRSLLSIKAELRKRQELFARYNVNHIDAYIKLFKKGQTKLPLPHLILIVDEFAELKMDQPDFMKELISAARIGRSLGVHLILATQKPSGVVDAQIWSNSKFKLCLKVQNKEDSNEVLKSPVAAEIKEPGRAYLQVGNNEVFELFQSAYSGATASFDEATQQKSFTIYSLDLSGRRTPVYSQKAKKMGEEVQTQLTAITNYISAYCKRNQIVKLSGICLPPLKDVIPLEVQVLEKEIGVVNIGVLDDPDNQYQGPALLDLLAGHTVIIGSSQYGKTNLLQLLIRSLTTVARPSEINLYVMDFASMALSVFSQLNHVGGVISPADDEKFKNFMRMIKKEMKYRKETFASMGITSFASYREAGKRDMAQIIIMIDNFLALKELYPNYEDDIIGICREGVAVGISLVVTSMQTNGISYKYMSNFSNRIVLYCNQSDEYGSVFDKCRLMPKNVPGRGLVELNRTLYEVQTYLAFEGKREIDRAQRIKDFIQRANEINANEHAVLIPEVPKLLNLNYVKQHYRKVEDYVVPVGIDYDTVDFVELDLTKTVTIAVTGRKGYGKTSFVCYLVRYLQCNTFNFESMVYIVDDYEQQLKSLSSMGIVERYTVDVSEFETMLEEAEERMQQRINRVKEVGIDAIREEALIVFVIQNRDVFAPGGISKNASERYKRLVKSYKDMKILFIFADVENAPIPIGMSASDMLKSLKEVGTMAVMDDLYNLKLVSDYTSEARRFKKPIELGDCYWIHGTDVRKIKLAYSEGGE